MDTTIDQSGLPLAEGTVTAGEVVPEVPTETIPQETQPETSEVQPQNQDLSPDNPQETIQSDNIVEVPTPPTCSNPLCAYCNNKEKYQTLIDDYINKSLAKTGDKVAIPFPEELILILDIEIDTFNTWVTDEAHTELISSIKKLVLLQRVRLLQRAAGRFDPSGAIYLLEKLHEI